MPACNRQLHHRNHHYSVLAYAGRHTRGYARRLCSAGEAKLDSRLQSQQRHHRLHAVGQPAENQRHGRRPGAARFRLSIGFLPEVVWLALCQKASCLAGSGGHWAQTSVLRALPCSVIHENKKTRSGHYGIGDYSAPPCFGLPKQGGAQGQGRNEHELVTDLLISPLLTVSHFSYIEGWLPRQQGGAQGES